MGYEVEVGSGHVYNHQVDQHTSHLYGHADRHLHTFPSVSMDRMTSQLSLQSYTNVLDPILHPVFPLLFYYKQAKLDALPSLQLSFFFPDLMSFLFCSVCLNQEAHL